MHESNPILVCSSYALTHRLTFAPNPLGCCHNISAWRPPHSGALGLGCQVCTSIGWLCVSIQMRNNVVSAFMRLTVLSVAGIKSEKSKEKKGRQEDLCKSYQIIAPIQACLTAIPARRFMAPSLGPSAPVLFKH